MSKKVIWRELPHIDANGVINGVELKPYVDGQEVGWSAQEGGQTQFLSSPIFETLATGNRGGGKSMCLLMDFAQHVGHGFGPDWKGVIFRQTYPQLQDIVSMSKKWFPKTWPAANFNQADMSWTFPAGEKLMFRHILSPDDYWNYHGWNIPWLGFEELTTWPDDKCFKSLFSICRATTPGMPRKIRCTTNPYGPGHGWVKARYHLPVPPININGNIIREVDADGNAVPERVAVRVELRDNKVMLLQDPQYLARIKAAARNESELAAWVDGSWDIVSGGMFDDVWNVKHNIVPQLNSIPRAWKINRAYDHGQSRPFSVGWYAESNGEPIILPDGRKIGTIPGDVIRFAEWYGWCGTPNEGLRLTAREVAYGIRERETEMGITGRVKTGVADSAIFDDYEPGHSVAGDMAKLGVHWIPIDKGAGSRAQGWQQMRQYMKNAWPVEKGTREHPGLFVCPKCEQFLRTVPVLPRDTKKLDDVDTTAEDHVGDEVRYRLRMQNRVAKSGKFK